VHIELNHRVEHQKCEQGRKYNDRIYQAHDLDKKRCACLQVGVSVGNQTIHTKVLTNAKHSTLNPETGETTNSCSFTTETENNTHPKLQEEL
jgi:hypothetical protein